MSRPFQFSFRALLVAMLAVACFFGGVRAERWHYDWRDMDAIEWAQRILAGRPDGNGDFPLICPNPDELEAFSIMRKHRAK